LFQNQKFEKPRKLKCVTMLCNEMFNASILNIYLHSLNVKGAVEIDENIYTSQFFYIHPRV